MSPLCSFHVSPRGAEQSPGAAGSRDPERSGSGAFLEFYADELIVLDADGEASLAITPEEHWQAVLTWGERFGGFAEERVQMDVMTLFRQLGVNRIPST